MPSCGRLVCYFKHCRLLLTAAMLSILAYVAATIGAPTA